MNRYIKNKKRINLIVKKSFSKEELLFQKQFPILFISCICKYKNITRLDLNKIYKKVIVIRSMSKDTFETTLKMILFRIDYDGCNFKKGSYGKYYYDLYTTLGIKFKDAEGNIKIKS